MSNAKTDYLENLILDHVLRGDVYTPPLSIYVGLYTTLPDDDGTGGVEVSELSYVRQVVTFSPASVGETSNNSVVQFPVTTEDWGTVVGIGLFDALSGGNLLYYGSLAVIRVVLLGDQLNFIASALVVKEH